MNTKIALGFVGLFNRLSNAFDRACKTLEGGVDGLEADGNAFEKFRVGICFRSAHEWG
jgi:hypothetical protein